MFNGNFLILLRKIVFLFVNLNLFGCFFFDVFVNVFFLYLNNLFLINLLGIDV